MVDVAETGDGDAEGADVGDAGGADVGDDGGAGVGDDDAGGRGCSRAVVMVVTVWPGVLSLRGGGWCVRCM